MVMIVVRHYMHTQEFDDHDSWPYMWAMPAANRPAILAWLEQTLPLEYTRWQGWVLFKKQEHAVIASMIWP